MHKFFSVLIAVLLIQISCNTNFNQYRKISESQQQRHGRWIEKDSVGGGEFKMKGKYRNGEKAGIWKTYYNGNLLQKDRIKNNNLITRIYFPDGKIRETGQSKLIITDQLRHWFYYGDWKYYGENGELRYIKTYHPNNQFDSISFLK